MSTQIPTVTADLKLISQYRIEHGLIIGSPKPRRCERHEIETEPDGEEKNTRHTCQLCVEELAAFQLSLGHRGNPFHHTDRNGLKGYTDPRGRNAGNRRQR